MTELPPFCVTTVGSWPRSQVVQSARRRLRSGELTREDFKRIADEAVVAAVNDQESAGAELVTDGEQRRDNFYSFVAEHLEGVRLMSLAEMLDLVEDRAGFESLLRTLDVPAFAIHSPVCVGKVRRRQPLAADDAAYLRRHTTRPVKVTLPGPYLLTRAMWVREASTPVYPSKEDLAADVVALLREEVTELARAGVDFIQLDEPVLTELVFAEGKTRTFMCASLAARNDPSMELEFAVELISAVLRGLSGTRTGMHVCRGNWSRRESTLLKGSYAALAPYLARLPVDQLVLEFATPRAGEIAALFESAPSLCDKELGLGVVNPRLPVIESEASIVARAAEALRYIPADRLFLNPDCGFATFESRPVNDRATAGQKLAAIAGAAATLRRDQGKGRSGAIM